MIYLPHVQRWQICQAQESIPVVKRDPKWVQLKKNEKARMTPKLSELQKPRAMALADMEERVIVSKVCPWDDDNYENLLQESSQITQTD